MKIQSDTRTRLLDLAQDMIQRQGFNAFSFRDLAAAAGIKSASVHYHFPTKSALGVELVRRYTESFGLKLQQIDIDHPSPAMRLRKFLTLFQQSLSDPKKLCLCGMLGSEYGTLTEDVRDQVRAFFVTCEKWVATTLEAGRADGSLNPKGPSHLIAATLMSTAQGASLTARPTGDLHRVQTATDYFMALAA